MKKTKKRSLRPRNDLMDGFNLLKEMGVTRREWQFLCEAKEHLWLGAPEINAPLWDVAMSFTRLARAMLIAKGIVYDKKTVYKALGFPYQKKDDRLPVPKACPGEVIVYYGGWDWLSLKTRIASKRSGSLQLLSHDETRDSVDYRTWKEEAGYYRLLLPVPKSNNLTWEEQLRLLAGIGSGWQPAPIVIATTALLIYDGINGDAGYNLLPVDNTIWRAAESVESKHVTIEASDTSKYDIELEVDAFKDEQLWLIAGQKC